MIFNDNTYLILLIYCIIHIKFENPLDLSDILGITHLLIFLFYWVMDINDTNITR